MKKKQNRYLKGGIRVREDGSFVSPAVARMSRRGFLGSIAAGVGAAAMAGSGVVRAHEPPPQEYVPCGQPHVSTLWAGKHINAGTVTVANDENNLYVEYATTGDWCLTETHLWVGTDLNDLPVAKQGQPIPGHFPYSEDHDCVTSYLYTIPLSELGIEDECDEDQLFVVPHAVVERPLNDCQETGVLYGILRFDGEVYGIDVLSGTSWLEFTIPAPPNPGSAAPNGLAYDPYTNRFYYTDYNYGTTPDTLYFWDGTMQHVAGQIAYGIVACGDIDNGMYYYIPHNTDDLYEITFNPDGTIATDTKLGDIANGGHRWSFNGDIAVKDGVLYGWGRCAIHNKYEYFTYDFSSVTPTLNLFTPAYQSSLQLAFGSDGNLYGHRSGGAGEFYVIDTSNGNVTMVTPTPTPARLYTDTASGEICEPEYQEETAFGCDEPPAEPYPLASPRWWCYINYSVQCCCSGAKIYGTSRGGSGVGGKIYEIDLDPSAMTAIEIDNTGLNTGNQNWPNGNAYDPVNKRFYYSEAGSNKLYFYDFNTSTKNNYAGVLRGSVACGTWYNGHYYYIVQSQNTLYRAAINPANGQIGSSIAWYTLNSGNFGGFGDIVMDLNTGRLYGSSGAFPFWYIDVAVGPTVGPLNKVLTTNLTRHMQLAFGVNGTLYCHNAANGTFYTINPATGNATSIGTVNYPTGGPMLFTDLASGPSCP